jgi:hypothetical protein
MNIRERLDPLNEPIHACATSMPEILELGLELLAEDALANVVPTSRVEKGEGVMKLAYFCFGAAAAVAVLTLLFLLQ